MAPSQQLSFADAIYANKGKVTRREKFLDQLEALLPWYIMLAEIEPHYALGKGARAQTVSVECHAACSCGTDCLLPSVS